MPREKTIRPLTGEDRITAEKGGNYGARAGIVSGEGFVKPGDGNSVEVSVSPGENCVAMGLGANVGVDHVGGLARLSAEQARTIAECLNCYADVLEGDNE